MTVLHSRTAAWRACCAGAPPIVEIFVVNTLQRARNVPWMMLMEASMDGRVLNNPMTRDEHQFAGWLHPSIPRHTVGSLEKGVNIIMRKAVHKEWNRAVIRDADPALIVTKLEDMVVIETTNGAYAAVYTQPSIVIFFEKRVNNFTMYVCSDAVAGCQGMCAKVFSKWRRHVIHVLRIIETEVYGSLGLSTCRKHIDSRPFFSGETRFVFFLWWHNIKLREVQLNVSRWAHIANCDVVYRRLFDKQCNPKCIVFRCYRVTWRMRPFMHWRGA